MVASKWSRAETWKKLESMRRTYGPQAAQKCEHVLTNLRVASFPDVESLIRCHDSLLFLRAFPQSAAVARMADRLLVGLEPQVEALAESPSAAGLLDDEAVSGIAGTTVTNTWTYDLARQLAARHPHGLSAEWNVELQYRQLGLTLPSCLPLLADDAFVEADTPYMKWIHAAAGRHKSDLLWMLDNIADLPVPPELRTSLFAGCGLNIAWNLRRSPASRTLARRPVRKLFHHREPLLQRKDVSLAREIAAPPLQLRKLNHRDGRAIIDMVQDAVTVRYRELQGTTYGDPKQVIEADVGRGVQLFLWGLDPHWRLPLRAYYAGFALKNGVPVNYFEAIGLFEWMEVGFNTFYAYREGETAWIYSQYLRLLHQIAGVTCISVYPYQIGQDNEEAIKSGAFWFYRKMGFRPGRRELLALSENEEARMLRDPAHRTSAALLRKLAQGHIFFEFDTAQPGQWDTFSTRTLGLAVQAKMAAEFGGSVVRMRRETAKRLCKLLGVDLEGWNARERRAFSDFAVALSLVPDMRRWSPGDKGALIGIISAKAGPDETQYLRRMQKHTVLREAMLRAGSKPVSAEEN